MLAAFEAAGLAESHRDWLQGNFYGGQPGPTGGDACADARGPLEHDHFFTDSGEFGSHDESGEEVEWRVPWWWVDAGKSIMLLLLAAVDEELGAGLFGLVGDANDGLRELLGMPEDLEVVGVVTIGHQGPRPSAGSRRKFPWKPLEEVVRWERW